MAMVHATTLEHIGEVVPLGILDGVVLMMHEDNIKITREKDYYVVTIDGEFYCSADTYEEALDDIKEYEKFFGK